MKNNKFSKIKVFNGLKGFVFGFVLAISLVAGAVYAWNAVWHGTNWIKSGGIIEAQKIAENFEYLYQELEKIKKDPPIPKGTIVAGCMLDVITRVIPGKVSCTYTDPNSGLEWPANEISGTSCNRAPDRTEVASVKSNCWGGAKAEQVSYLTTGPDVRQFGRYWLKLSCPVNTRKIMRDTGTLFVCIKD